ncbi:MAG: RnfABCDGE type electron transport complex subunit C, partial [Clostridia bacterium]
MPLGFKGGIHPDDKKSLTAGKPIEEAHAPNQVILPMSMHIGAMCNPLVSVGERVLMGQLVAESAAPVSAPIHASVSGTVSAIEPRYAPTGVRVMSIVIDNDFMDEMVPLSRTDTKFSSLDADALAEICRTCGIVGLGGAAFPVSIKIKSAVGCVDTLIINGAECEPYITSDNRLIIEHGVELLEGATIIMKALGLPSVHIAIESNKRAAIEHLRKLAAGKSHIILDVLHTKYPQGSEKHLIRAITGREIPPGKLPTAVGAININVATTIAINRAVETGMPLIKK